MGEKQLASGCAESDSESEDEVPAVKRIKPEELSLESRLRSFYLQYNPEKVDDAVKVARLFAGKEDQLNERLRARYDGKDLGSCMKLASVEDTKDQKLAP